MKTTKTKTVKQKNPRLDVEFLPEEMAKVSKAAFELGLTRGATSVLPNHRDYLRRCALAIANLPIREARKLLGM